MRSYSVRSGFRSMMLAVAAIGLYAGSALAASPGGSAPGFGQPSVGQPGFGQANNNGVWSWPAMTYPSFQISSNTGAFTGYNVGNNLIVAIRNDGGGVTWGHLDFASGRWAGSWMLAQGVACPFPAALPLELTAVGFQFPQPVFTWGTFDVMATPTAGGLSFDGAWGGCGVPIGGPWNGQIRQ